MNEELAMRVRYRVKKLREEYGHHSGMEIEYVGYENHSYRARMTFSMEGLNVGDDFAIDLDGSYFFNLRRQGFNVSSIRVVLGPAMVPTSVWVYFDCTTNPIIDQEESDRIGRFKVMTAEKIRRIVNE